MANIPKIQRFGSIDISDLYAYKGAPKPKRQKVYETPTEYKNVDSASFSGPFGSGSSTLNKENGSIDSTATLSPELQNSANLAQSGLTSNLGYINRNPQEQVSFATSGQDPYYNVLNEQAKQAFDNNLGNLRLQAFKGGGLNSTAAGAAYGNLAYNKNLYDNQILQSALNFGNQQATQNAQTNLGAIGGMAQLVYPLQSAANAQLNTALQSNDRVAATNAAAQNAAEAAYQAELNKYNASRMTGSQFWSTMFPVYGMASGNYNEAVQGTALQAQIIGSILGAGGGGGFNFGAQGGLGSSGFTASQPNFGMAVQ